tara:strand:+ start:396 stop:770 length:375 start_codon:yes stop_codon:yes gene_type:complete
MSEKKYSKEHEWIIVDKDIATVGITNHAQESLGDIVFVELPNLGSTVTSGAEVSTIESVKAASDIYSPVDGEIVEINDKLSSDASIINNDAENEGWIFKLKITNSDQIDSLMSLSEYNEFLKTI